MALIANVKIQPVLGMWPGFGVLSSLQMGELGMGEPMGESSPAAVPSASSGESRNTHRWARKKKVLPSQAGIYSWEVISSLPPFILPFSPSSIFLTPSPDLEALSSLAVGAGDPEHPVLLSGVLIRCQDRKGSLWVSCTTAQTISSDISQLLHHPVQEG